MSIFGGIFDNIEKFIIEHGSAAILRQQLEFTKDQFFDMERKVSDLQTQVGRLEAQLERERTDYEQVREDFQRLKDEHTEEICIQRAVELRRGKRTGGKWIAFCPKCHIPALYEGRRRGVDNGPHVYCTDAKCGWSAPSSMSIEKIIEELGA
jgi:TolA-binding protein